MTSNEPDAVTWQRLFASLVSAAAVDGNAGASAPAQGLAMILTRAEQQLIRIIRAANRHDLNLSTRTRDGRYTVRITTYDGGPGTVPGEGISFDAAWHDVSEERAQQAG
jgi:hypothetical protein